MEPIVLALIAGTALLLAGYLWTFVDNQRRRD
jgi:hypothetical protein